MYTCHFSIKIMFRFRAIYRLFKYYIYFSIAKTHSLFNINFHIWILFILNRSSRWWDLSKGHQRASLFEPEESKETALGFRGTRLWNQSLVCYTFVQQTAAKWRSTLLSWRTRCPCGAAWATKKGWQFVPKSTGCQPFAVCGTKVYRAPPQRMLLCQVLHYYFLGCFPLWLVPLFRRLDFRLIWISQCFSVSVSLL